MKHINFEKGDYVLVASTLQILKDKLTVRWEGPYLCVGTVDPNIYIVQHLLQENVRKECHASRMKFFADGSLELTEEIMSSVMYDSSEKAVVGNLVDVRQNAATGTYEILVHWKGYDSIHDTWEPLEILKQDIPELVTRFLSTCQSPVASLLVEGRGNVLMPSTSS